jgi:hypothetical protein
MSISKTAVFSLLAAGWLVGLVNQLHAWNATVFYLALSMLIVAVLAPKRTYRMVYVKSRNSRQR